MIEHAVQLLRAGKLVAFPTETVYGLGADARNASAVQRIFAVKGRPSTNPLIVHVASSEVAKRYARSWDQRAEKLTRAFWPGPLTIVIEKDSSIVAEATAGQNTVGLRVPNHLLTLELLRAFDGPLVGPSANKSTRVSPTTADHVRDEFGESIELILDGGPCAVGVESTVIDLTRVVPTVLRPGAVTAAQLRDVLGEVRESPQFLPTTQTSPAPGQGAVHYAPRTPAFRFETEQLKEAADLAFSPAVVLAFSEFPRKPGVHVFQMPTNVRAFERLLYAQLRLADNLNAIGVYVELPPNTAEWAAVRDRLYRAARPLT